MSRAVVAGIVVAALLLAACGGSADALRVAPACSLLGKLAQTGQTVASADVSDPTAFDATMRTAVKAYVRTAQQLRDAVPANLKGDVDRMITAAEHRRFTDADAARARIDAYAHSACTTR